MNIAQISLWDEAYRPLAEITYFHNKLDYCNRRGYEAHYMDSGFVYEKAQIGFEKMRFILRLFEERPHLDWIHFTGCDTLVTNFEVRIEDILEPWKDSRHMVVCFDGNGMNVDSFLIRNSPQGRGLMRWVLDVKPQYEGHYWYEQQALIDFYFKAQGAQEIIQALPQRVMNSYLYDLYPEWRDRPHVDHTGHDGDWRPGDFILHLPGISLSERIRIMTEFQGRIVR